MLKEFDAISVRDKNSHDIIKTLTAIDPIDSIDPVLLYDFSNEVDNIDVDLSNYIVVYAYSERINKIEAEAIQAFAHSKGKKTLSIGVKQSFTDLYVNVDPFTLLAYIKNADYVITVFLSRSTLFKCPEKFQAMAGSYIVIIIAGLIATFLYDACVPTACTGRMPLHLGNSCNLLSC